MFTGKNKEAFEKWYKNNPVHHYMGATPFMILIKDFYRLDIREQQGVFLEYLDSVGIQISPEQIGGVESGNNWRVSIPLNERYMMTHTWLNPKSAPTREEALTEAFKKADELRNIQLK